MKILPRQKHNLQNNSNNIYSNFNKSNYSTNTFCRIKQLDNDTVSFRGYLDDEKWDKERELERCDERIAEIKESIRQEKSNFRESRDELNAKIAEQNSDNRRLSREIDELTHTRNRKNNEIKGLRRDGSGIQADVEQGTKRLDGLKTTQRQLLTALQQNNSQAEQVIGEHLSAAMRERQQVYKQDLENLLTGPKATLIREVINPTVAEYEGEQVKIPQGILLESEAGDTAKNVFRWLVGKTNSHTAFADAAGTQDYTKLLGFMSHIAMESKERFDSDRVRTYTFVDNIESHATPEPKNEAVIAEMRKFLSLCSEQFHNTVVFATRKVSALSADFTDRTILPLQFNISDFFTRGKKPLQIDLSRLRQGSMFEKPVIGVIAEAMSTTIRDPHIGGLGEFLRTLKRFS